MQIINLYYSSIYMPVVNREGGMKRWGELLTERGNNVCCAESPPPPSHPLMKTLIGMAEIVILLLLQSLTLSEYSKMNFEVLLKLWQSYTEWIKILTKVNNFIMHAESKLRNLYQIHPNIKWLRNKDSRRVETSLEINASN